MPRAKVAKPVHHPAGCRMHESRNSWSTCGRRKLSLLGLWNF
jgi:hypothetical protein